MNKLLIEDIVLRYSGRGMDILRKFIPDNFAEKAALSILSWDKGNVFITTGFYVAGFAETDGPAGAVFLAKALKTLGFKPFIITDEFCKDFFEPERLDVIYIPFDSDESIAQYLLETFKPAGLISIERCGININGEYANMKGENISDKTARIDMLFRLALGTYPTIGIGDGGNEIGMGNVADIINLNLSISPCIVSTEYLVIATVSNWGAYAVIAYLQRLSGRKVFMSFDEVNEYILRTVKKGSVDGVLKEPVCSVDGFGMDIEKEIITSLGEII